MTLLDYDADTQVLSCRGAWVLSHCEALERLIACHAGEPVRMLEVRDLTRLDTAGAWLLCRLCRQHEIGVPEDMHPTHAALLRRIREISSHDSTAPAQAGMLARIGLTVIKGLTDAGGFLSFVGEISALFLRTLLKLRTLRLRMVLAELERAGVAALPIIGLLAFLMGVVIAYQSALQLARYGANIFIADLVGFSMLRELSPLLAAIIAAGRSGSAYAAEIGTLRVTEELDALRTMGISPYELLVLPKCLALMLALPLLTVYADAVGVLGGMVVAKSALGVGYVDFLDRFKSAVDVTTFWVGMVKAPVFAAAIAMVGCYQGLKAGGSADSVGRLTTLSVVQGIFLVIVLDAGFSVLFSALDL